MADRYQYAAVSMMTTSERRAVRLRGRCCCFALPQGLESGEPDLLSTEIMP